jgi:serine phosphatase RsbU (regulator of sigma subunit)
MYTDGITEAHNTEGEMFGTARLDRELDRVVMQAELDALVRSMLH